MNARRRIKTRAAFTMTDKVAQKANVIGKTIKRNREKKKRSGGKNELVNRTNDCNESFVMR
jgi:hypothetical protein